MSKRQDPANSLMPQALDLNSSSPISLQLKKVGDKGEKENQSSSPMSQNFIATKSAKEGPVSPMSANRKAPLSPMSLNKAKKETQLSPLSALRFKEGSDDSLEGKQSKIQSLEQELANAVSENQKIKDELNKVIEKKKKSNVKKTNEFVTLQQQLQAQKEEKDALGEQFTALQQDKERVCAEMDELASQMAQLNEEKDSVAKENQEAMATMQAEAETLRTQIAKLTSEKEAIKEEKFAATYELYQLREERASWATERDTLKTASDQLFFLKEELKGVRDEKDGAAKALLAANEERESLAKSLATAHEEKAELARAVLRASEEKETVVSELRTANEVKETWRLEKEKLVGQLFDLQAKIEESNKQRDSVQVTIDELNAEVEAKRAENEELKTQMQIVNERNQSLTQQESKASTSSDQQLSTLRDEFQSLKVEKDDLWVQLLSVKEETKHARDEAANARTKIDELERGRASFEAERETWGVEKAILQKMELRAVDEENQKNLLASQKEEIITKMSELENSLKIQSDLSATIETELDAMILQNNSMKSAQEKVVSQMKKNDEEYSCTIRKMQEELIRSDQEHFYSLAIAIKYDMLCQGYPAVLNINDLWHQVESVSKDKWPEFLMQIFHSFQDAPQATLDELNRPANPVAREEADVAAMKVPKPFQHNNAAMTQPLNSLPIQDESDFLRNKSQTYSNYSSAMRKSDRTNDKKERNVYYIY